MYGNGSDGTFNHTSGTTTLALDTKHQFTTFNVASGARLEASGVGSVLYITATDSINISGTVVAWNTQRGQNSLSVTIDGVTYTSPGTANGGAGGNSNLGANGGQQGLGYGGGGAGGSANGYERGGHGGNGAPSGISGGSSISIGPDISVTAGIGNDGASSGGGSGGYSKGVSGGQNSYVSTGAGGSSYGSGGGNGVATSYAGAAGGGGAGGRAGMPGVHIVLKAPSVAIGGLVYTRPDNANGNGTSGGNGGSAQAVGITAIAGSGGGGGGGANAGSIYITGMDIDYGSGTIGVFGSTGGPGGTGYQAGSNGLSGLDGSVYVYTLAQPYPGPFYRVWGGTDWIYASGKVRDASAFKRTKAEVL